MVDYKTRLSSDPTWALAEASRHFEARSSVYESLQRIARYLSGMGIPYAVSGAIALFHYALRRFGENIEVLITPMGLQSIHESLSGLGYLPSTPGGKNLRDTQTGVRIDFIITGTSPPVASPSPSASRRPNQLPMKPTVSATSTSRPSSSSSSPPA